MSKATKRIFAVVLAIALCFHFIMLFIYCTPVKIRNQKLNFLSYLYVYPVFHQNWILFVPAPNAERKLFVRYKTNNQFTNWQDILGNEIINHKKYRFLGGEAKVLLLSNALIYELNYLDEKNSFIFTTTPTNNEFKVLQFEVNQYLKSRFKLTDNATYDMLLVSSGTNKTKAYYMQSLTIN